MEAIDTSSGDFLIASFRKRKPDKEVDPSTKRRISEPVPDKEDIQDQTKEGTFLW